MSAQLASANLVLNPSLETRRTGDPPQPTAWTPSRWGSNTATFRYESHGATGARSVTTEITSYTSGDAKWVFDSVAVTPGAVYVYRDTYRSTAVTSIVAAYRRSDGTMSYLTVKSVPASAQWTSAAVSIPVPAGVSRLSVYHLIAAVGRLQIDDVSVTVPGSADLSSGVPNGNLETPSPTDSTQPLAWRSSSWGVNTPTFRYGSFGNAGGRGVQLTVTGYVSGDAKWVFDAQPVTAGTRYLYSDIYASDADSALVAEVRLRDGTVRYLSLGALPPSTSFTPARAAFVAPPDAASVVVFHLLRKNGTLTIDDVGLSALAPVPLVDGVPGGDMEHPAFPGADAPAGWSRNGYGSNDATFSYPTEGHGGTRSLRVQISAHTSGRAGWHFDAQPVTPGGTYRFRDFYRSNVDTIVTAQVWLTDGSSVELYLPPAFATPTWAPYVTDVALPANAARMTVHHQLGRVGYLQTDDYSLLPASDSPFQRALVSLSFDDGWRTDFDNVLPVLEAHRVVATHYVPTGFLGQQLRMNGAMLVTLAQRGNEIGSHTVTHSDLTTLTATQLDAELTMPKPVLEALGVGPIASFASPYGAYNATTLAAIAGRYRSHRTTDVGYNRREPFDIYALKVQNIRSTTTVSEVDGWAAHAAATRSWLILVYHDVEDPPRSIYGTTPANLDAHVRALKNRGLPILTVTQALEELVPQL